MFTGKQIMQSATELLSFLRDTRYATTSIDERLALAKLEVSRLRTALIAAEFPTDADEYATKLKLAQKEYLRILKLSQKNKAV